MSKRGRRRERPQRFFRGKEQTYAVVKHKGYMCEVLKTLIPEEHEKNIRAGMLPPEKEFRVMKSGLTRQQAYREAVRIASNVYLAQIMVLPEPCSEKDLFDCLYRSAMMYGTDNLVKASREIREFLEPYDDDNLPYNPVRTVIVNDF